MGRIKSVEDYIDKAAHWSGELVRLRNILQRTELTEEIKWGAPCYTYENKNIVSIGAFKSYFGLWFHQGALLPDEKKVLINAQEGKTKALRQWRMHSSRDIKPATVKRYVKAAIQLAKDGKSIGPAKKKSTRMPDELQSALKRDTDAAAKFAELTPGKQREYSDYISDAKRSATKQSRVQKIIPLIKSGAGLNDQYR
ncbi:MAG: YdeI/OmpD-associated family protein [Woeseiaceae bacterium]